MVRDEGIICSYDLANFYPSYVGKRQNEWLLFPDVRTTKSDKQRKEWVDCGQG